MNSVLKKVLSCITILCAVLVLEACSPDADSTAKTEVIVIKNIPAIMFRTDSDQKIDGEPTYKVYVQLADSMDADKAHAILGEVDKTDTSRFKEADGRITATIELASPSSKWLYHSVVIRPKEVKDIYDIDIKAGMSGPSTSSTVVLDWKDPLPRMMPKDFMNMGGKGTILVDGKEYDGVNYSGIYRYKRLYGLETFTDGVIGIEERNETNPGYNSELITPPDSERITMDDDPENLSSLSAVNDD